MKKLCTKRKKVLGLRFFSSLVFGNGEKSMSGLQNKEFSLPSTCTIIFCYQI